MGGVGDWNWERGLGKGGVGVRGWDLARGRVEGLDGEMLGYSWRILDVYDEPGLKRTDIDPTEN